MICKILTTRQKSKSVGTEIFQVTVNYEIIIGNGDGTTVRYIYTRVFSTVYDLRS